MSDETTKKTRVARYFAEMAPGYDQHGPRWFAHFGRRLVELADVSEGAHVLDVATGRGAVLFAAAAQVGSHGRVVGIDMAQGMLRETQAELEPRELWHVEVRPMDAEELDFPDESFDRVLCGFALFFLPRLDHALRGFLRVLKPGGLFAASTWAPRPVPWQWLEELYEEYGIRSESLTTQLLDNEDDLRAALEGAGFEAVQVILEEDVFYYKDEEEWWTRYITHNGERDISVLAPEQQEAFKAEVFSRLQTSRGPRGIERPMPVFYALGRKPGR